MRPGLLTALMLQEVVHRHAGIQPGQPHPLVTARTQHRCLQPGVLHGWQDGFRHHKQLNCSLD